jgi:hypothetical protein
MKLSFVPLLAGLLVLATGSAPAQDTRSGVPGVLRSDGTFRPFVMRPMTNLATGTEVTGTLELKLSVTLVTALPEGTTILCGLVASDTGENSGGLVDDFGETATVAATVSGKTATCSPTIPYEWLIRGTGDQLSASYTVTAVSGMGTDRTSQGSIGLMSLPASGTTTKFEVKTRI